MKDYQKDKQGKNNNNNFYKFATSSLLAGL